MKVNTLLARWRIDHCSYIYMLLINLQISLTFAPHTSHHSHHCVQLRDVAVSQYQQTSMSRRTIAVGVSQYVLYSYSVVIQYAVQYEPEDRYREDVCGAFPEVLGVLLKDELKDRAARDKIRQIHLRGNDPALSYSL